MIFAGLTAWDTQAIKQMYFSGDTYEMVQKKSIHGALRLYLDFINMFQAILMLTGRSATTDMDRPTIRFPRLAYREPGDFFVCDKRASACQSSLSPARPPSNKARACGPSPTRRLQRAAGEQRAILGMMAEDDPLALAGEDDAVIADDRAAAQRREADVADAARTGQAVTAAREWSLSETPRPSAAASPSRSAVPDGASTFMR